MTTSTHKWHFHIYMYKDKICWYYRLGRADISDFKYDNLYIVVQVHVNASDMP